MTAKTVVAVWGENLSAALGADFVAECRSAGASRVQININDAAVAGAMQLSVFEPPIDAVLGIWADDPQPVLDLLTAKGLRIAAWAVTVRAPLDPELPADGSRIDALANIAFLRRPAEQPYDEWFRIWQEDHTQVAIDTQATFGYYQNIVERPLTPDTPQVDAIVEELFPMGAVSDPHEFYGSGGDDAELTDRVTKMMASVSRFGAHENLDVVPTSRFDYR